MKAKNFPLSFKAKGSRYFLCEPALRDLSKFQWELGKKFEQIFCVLTFFSAGDKTFYFAQHEKLPPPPMGGAPTEPLLLEEHTVSVCHLQYLLSSVGKKTSPLIKQSRYVCRVKDGDSVPWMIFFGWDEPSKKWLVEAIDIENPYLHYLDLTLVFPKGSAIPR